MKRFIIALSAVAVVAAACSSQTSKDSESAPATSETTSTASKPAAHVGDTLDLARVDGTKIGVTVMQVINPATVAKGAGDPGKTYLATKLKLADTGTVPIEGDVNVNVALVGSDNQIYIPDLNDVTECTNFESGEFHLEAGESTTGCVVFALPHGVTPTKVKYTPSAGFSPDFGEWQVS
ncbi:MAG TPA: hypothetical protein VFQ37_03510 [Mycobacterium sp.]|nr:hypothetical protein [Mycobacterium sp.]